MLNKRTLLLFLVVVTTTSAYSQQALVCLGGDAVGTGGSVSFSAGQITYITSTSSSGSSAEGVQQPYEISEVDMVATLSNYAISVYPNPTLDEIKLNIQNQLSAELSYQLYDINGQLIEYQGILASITDIDTDCLAAGTYFLKIMDGDRLVKTFKVLKN
ncbi:MAG: T9SS type A sorting domain-containing protein [Flavobacteriales bacterium]